MSYGVWKKRGKGWSSFEIDGSDQWSDQWGWGQMPAVRAKSIQKRACVQGWTSEWTLDHQDASYVVWRVGQHERGRQVSEVCTGGDHRLFISYSDDQSKEKALRANGYLDVNGKRIEDHLEFN